MVERNEREGPIREGPIGVRLPAEVKKALEVAAEANNRSLHGEIVHRLTMSADPKVESRTALGQLLEILETRLGWLMDRSGAPPAASLAMLQEGFDAMLDEIGAGTAELTEDQQSIARAIGRQTASDVRSAEPVTGTPPPGMADQFETKNRLARIQWALAWLRNKP